MVSFQHVIRKTLFKLITTIFFLIVADQKVRANGKVVVDKTTAEVAYNTADEDLQLSVSHDLDANNTPKGSYSTKTGEVAYGICFDSFDIISQSHHICKCLGWTRKWNGGELDGTYHPGNGGKAVLEWTDKGSKGDWKTRAEVPLANHEIGNSKVSIKREWKY